MPDEKTSNATVNILKEYVNVFFMACLV